MVVASKKKEPVNWHIEALPRLTQKALNVLAGQEWLKKTDWYLAGGTALALQAGHRQSVDLDFFLPRADFRIPALLKHFDGLDWEVDVAKEGTIYGRLLGAKVSFIAYPFFISALTPLMYGNIKVLKSADIAVMKIIAISQRGRKRDFFDLYWYIKNAEPLGNIMSRLSVQYPTVAHDFHHIIKSLVYFVDAENDPTPKIKFRATWKEVKKFFQEQAKQIARDLYLK